MATVTLRVETNDNNTQVVISARTITNDVVEDRTYLLDPVQSVDIANAILHCAEDCGVNVQVQTEGISNERRLRLIQRTEHVIRSLSGRKLNIMSSHVVDTILAEVLK